ncbi:MAG: aminoacyl-tRNA hydrolase [Gammaproteobacteria bacterium]|nr:aminoacyl-tRNA hydrolase [Gammaproteobacteria bacterium]
MSPIKLIVGLANPGVEYARTRHNAGAWFVETICAEFKSSLQHEAKFHGVVGKFECNGNSCRVLIPSTYMNLSGLSVVSLALFYKILPEQILIVHDELDLPAGDARLKLGGGHGGHNGLRDIIAHLNTQDFYRLRLGIGHPGHKDRVADYVLHAPSKEDEMLIHHAIADSMRVLPNLMEGKMQQAMTKLHTL